MDPHPISSSACSACGTSPMSHKMLLFNDLFGTYVTVPLQKIIGRLPRFRLIRWLEDSIAHVLARVLLFLHVIHFSRDSELAVSGRSKLIWLEASRRGIAMEQAILFKKPIEF